MNPVFKNRKNEPLLLEDGRTVWNSRSCAVVAQICLYHKVSQQWYVLLGQRGQGAPDFQGWWGLPCGYLDWDETLCEAVVREVWEECGLFLPALSSLEGFIGSQSSLTQPAPHTDVPWAVTDHIDNDKQNISLHYAVLFAWRGEALPALSMAHAEPDEVEALAWVSIQEAVNMRLAFNHHKRIDKLIAHQADAFAHIEKLGA